MFHGILCSAYWIFQILCPNLHFSYIGSESTTWISELGPLFCIVGATGPITSHKTRLCNRKKLRVDYNHDRVLCSIWKNGKAEGVPGGREDYYVESSSGYIPEFSHLQPHLPFFFFSYSGSGYWHMGKTSLPHTLSYTRSFLRVRTSGTTDKSIFRVVQVVLFLNS